MRAEEGGGAGGFGFGHVFRSALGDDFSTRFATFGAQVDEVIRLGKDIQVVLDHDHSMAGIDETMEQVDQPADVGQMQAHGRLLQKEQVMGRTAGPAPGLCLIGGDLGGGQFRDELEALGLAARKVGLVWPSCR